MMEIDKYEALLEKAKDFDNLRNGGIWRIVEELVEAVEDLLEENSFLAVGKDSDKGFALGWKAAIEAVAQSCLSSAYVGERDGYHFAYTIRSIPMPVDAQATLDRLTTQVRAQGMREAAEIVEKSDVSGTLRPSSVLNMAIITRAEEIEKELRNE